MDAPVVVKLKQERESSTTMAHAVNLDRDLKQEESIFVFLFGHRSTAQFCAEDPSMNYQKYLCLVAQLMT